MSMKLYAVKYMGKWYVARLAMAIEYDANEHWAHKPPCWSESETTAYICDWHEPEEVIALPA